MKTYASFNLLWFAIWVTLAACDKAAEEPVPSADNGYSDLNPWPESRWQSGSSTGIDLKFPEYFGKTKDASVHEITWQKVALGRMLFYDKRLSKDGTISCGTCHQQQKGFSDGLPVAVGIDGQKGEFSSMTIANLAWENKFFWDGRSESLQDQALKPIENPIEMNLPIDSAISRLNAITMYRNRFKSAFGTSKINREHLASAIASFELALISGNSKYDRYLRSETSLSALEKKGMDLFFTHPEPTIGLRGANCGDCHLGPRVAGDAGFAGFHNNGLDSIGSLKMGLKGISNREADKGKFKAPSLRNIARTAPYMHDGRFSSLEEVLDHYDQHIVESPTLDVLILEASNEIRTTTSGAPKLKLTQEEKSAVLAFLKTLSDEEFLNDPDLSDPFQLPDAVK